MTETSAQPVRKPTIYTFTGVVSVTDSTGVESRYVRELMFVVNHHEHFRDDTVDVWVENARRPGDTFDFRAHQRQGLSGVLGEIHDYMSEQERRAHEHGDTIGQRGGSHQSPGNRRWSHSDVRGLMMGHRGRHCGVQPA